MPNRKPRTENREHKIIFLVGPTAIGKSALAMRLAKKLNAEIISLDSMQIYKGLNIISSKPDKNMQRQLRHHLLGVISPEKEFDSASYRKLALGIINEIHKKGKIPLFVGGSGLYMSVLVDGIFEDVKKDEALRKKLYAQGKRRGNIYLYNKLKLADKAASDKIHPNDLRRIVRALEVYELTAKPISELWLKRKGLRDKCEIKIFGLNKDRQELYNDINERVEKMFRSGAVREVKRLLNKKLSRTCQQAIGIKEIRGYLEGRYDLGYAKELLKKNTRHYGKRQLTWFRKDRRICWVDASKDNALKEIMSKL